jgi:hypothetical protein
MLILLAVIASASLLALAAFLRHRATRPRQRPDTMDVLARARVTDPGVWMRLR